MCNHRIVNPDLAPENFDFFVLMMKAVTLLMMSIMPLLRVQAMPMPVSFFLAFSGHISTVSHFLNQPQCDRMAKFLTWIRMLRMNKA